MQKTLEVLFDGRKRFENGDVLVKRELLQSLGSNITILDGKLNISPYKWLIPIQENYKTLEKQFDEVRTSSEQRKNSQISAIRSEWRKREDSNLRDVYKPPTRFRVVRLQPLGHASTYHSTIPSICFQFYPTPSIHSAVPLHKPALQSQPTKKPKVNSISNSFALFSSHGIIKLANTGELYARNNIRDF